jgi:hypothetical protein
LGRAQTEAVGDGVDVTVHEGRALGWGKGHAVRGLFGQARNLIFD